MNRTQAITKAKGLRKGNLVWTPDNKVTSHASNSAARRAMRQLGVGVALKGKERFPEPPVAIVPSEVQHGD